MAIKYDHQITNVDVLNKRADVTVKRTDESLTEAPMSFAFKKLIIAGETPAETLAIRLAFLETLKTKVLEEEQKIADMEEVVTNLEQQANSAMETWETTR